MAKYCLFTRSKTGDSNSLCVHGMNQTLNSALDSESGGHGVAAAFAACSGLCPTCQHGPILR